MRSCDDSDWRKGRKKTPEIKSKRTSKEDKERFAQDAANKPVRSEMVAALEEFFKAIDASDEEIPEFEHIVLAHGVKI
jgi:hypothetical protein